MICHFLSCKSFDDRLSATKVLLLLVLEMCFKWTPRFIQGVISGQGVIYKWTTMKLEQFVTKAELQAPK